MKKGIPEEIVRNGPEIDVEQQLEVVYIREPRRQ